MKHDSRMVSLVYLVCLVERDKPNERNKPDEPDQRVPASIPGCFTVGELCAVHSESAVLSGSVAEAVVGKW